jgi:hypothetical protein
MDMAMGKRKKVFSSPSLDQIFLQLFDHFHERFLFEKLILKLNDFLTHCHRAPLEMLSNM